MPATAQTVSRYNTFSYNVNEGLLQTALIDMAFDKNNYGWISFPAGIQKFDGKNFSTVPVQDGLPDDKQVKFFRTESGELLISHGEGISHYNARTNKFNLLCKEKRVSTANPLFLGEYGGVIYYFGSQGNIAGLDSRSLATVPLPAANNSFSKGRYARQAGSIINRRTSILLDSAIYLIDVKTGRALYPPLVVQDIWKFFLHQSSDDEVLFFETQKGAHVMQRYHFSTGRKVPVFLPESSVQLSRSNLLNWQGVFLFSVFNRLYQMNKDFNGPKIEMVNFANEPIAASFITRLVKDNYDNLYICTINSGIHKIVRNNYPLKYYGTNVKANNYVLSVFPDKSRNRVLAGTYERGLLIFDTTQKLVKQISSLPGRSNGFSVMAIVSSAKGDYYLFGLESGIWKLSSDLQVLTPVKIISQLPPTERGVAYFTKVVYTNSREAVVQSQNNVYRLQFETDIVTESQVSDLRPSSALLHGNTIVMQGGDELIYLDTASLREVKRILLKNTGGVRCFENDGSTIYAGCNKGIFVIDSAGNIRQHLTRQSGLPDECIYAMAFDAHGTLWCSSNRGIFRLSKANKMLQLTKNDGLQENEFNTNAVAEAEDGELFFGGVNGISSFYPSAISRYEDRPNILITGLKINNESYATDNAVWTVEKLMVPFDQSSFSFDFVAMGPSNPDQYIYQYKMEGVDKEWMLGAGLQPVRYSLQPGSYKFSLYASRQFDPDAKPLKEVFIIVKPPFWKTWWFLAVIGVAVTVALAVFINQRNKLKFAKKLRQLEAEQQLKIERERISKDLHDSIGAYANSVLYDIELLEQEKETERRTALIGELKFASKEIITSLRETVWALKKESYTAEECLVRLRNFIQPLTRSYGSIHFSVDGEAPALLSLHYTKALNLVRMVQEGVANSIKHAGATNISVEAHVVDGRWVITAADDGRGFDLAAEKQKAEGNGLHNLYDRAAASGFLLDIVTTPRKGTCISISV